MATTGRRSLQAPWVWRPADLVADDWTVELTEAERHEIAGAAREAARRGDTVATLQREAFALPVTAARIDAWTETLAAGRGFVLLHGFPVDLLDERETELAYFGLGLHLGTPVGQNADGDLLGHIRDERLPAPDVTVRRYRTRQRQEFHSDGADLVGLLCLHGALRGGASRIVSAGAVYNEILARRPDLLEVLYEPFAWDGYGQQPAGQPPFFLLAPFRDVGGVPRIFYIGWYIRDAQRHPEAPRLTPPQVEAMDLLESIADDPAFHLRMDFRAGDVQLLNNARILHARDEYEDADDPAERRHLLRLWLAAHRFASVEDGLRRGVARPR